MKWIWCAFIKKTASRSMNPNGRGPPPAVTSGILRNKTVVVTALGVIELPTRRVPRTWPELRGFFTLATNLLERNACGCTRLAEVAKQMGYRRQRRRHARYLQRCSEVAALA
jgi:hypothetical protein